MLTYLVVINSLYAICNDSVMAELIVSCSQTLYEANTNTFIPTDELYIKSIALKKPCLIQIPAKICLGLCDYWLFNKFTVIFI